MTSKCERCLNSRVGISENGFHPICCLSRKAAMLCITGRIDHFIPFPGEKKEGENDEKQVD